MLECEAHWIFNRLYLGLRIPRGLELAEVTLRGPDGQIIARDETTATDAHLPVDAMLRMVGRAFSRQYVSVFVVAEFGGSAWRDLTGHAVIATLDGAQYEAKVAVQLTEVGSFPFLYPLLVDHLRKTSPMGSLADALHGSRVASRQAPAAHVDVAYWEAGSFFIHGWLREHTLDEVIFACDGVSFVVEGSDALGHERPDVREFLRSQGIVSPRGGGGFSVVVPATGPKARLTIVAKVAAQHEVIFAEEIGSGGSRDRILPIMLSARGHSGHAPLANVARMMSCFFPQRRDDPLYDVTLRYVGSGGRKPELSVVVPFYREWRFLFPLLKQIERAPAEWEWVVVCDDPSIVAPLNRMLTAQPLTLRERVTFVRMARNHGFGIANNVGALVASAQTLLLMNSDVWFGSFEALSFALALMSQGDYGLLGFRLLFEDGTIQHNGMALESRADFDNLYLATHPGKGLLPKSRTSLAVEPVDLVTGALMLVPRGRFLDAGGFSHAYVGGDFEDADLCLRLSEAGERIGLVTASDIFHLERQSIRKDSENAVAFARTLINCVTFNTAWGSRIGIARPEA